METSKILVFVSSTCPGCKHLIDSLDVNLGNLIFVSNSILDEKSIFNIEQHYYSYINSPDLFHKFRLSGVPKAFIINRFGMIEKIQRLQTWKDLINDNQNQKIS